ncbi:hypothetical protein H6F44_22310 [Pseudanabaena sp. FACHB-1277]|jgi:hypothetical protein|uniref:Uncharacterized protein n=1 Tax=Pseudanabaena cinerea FACHB-1277 TaxID=2949581 RepID=A0A926UX37_9CYAN|nr:hypothetical protein [Pseudanabaena cinerea]MBD2152822.1 hypothetical protein [Pseudanabaena cinerea FACHB-1277]
MTVSQQKVYLITDTQRDALLSYLQERPYKEVAAGIEFLLNATTATLSASSESDATPGATDAPSDAPDGSQANSPE